MDKALYDIVAPLVERHEGRKRYPYTDAVGKLTIGVGHNLTDRGLTNGQIDDILLDDLMLALADAQTAVGVDTFNALSLNRQAVLIDMAFNLGLGKLTAFTSTILAIQQGRYYDASNGMLQSKWAKQVGRRATELAQMMKTS